MDSVVFVIYGVYIYKYIYVHDYYFSLRVSTRDPYDNTHTRFILTHVDFLCLHACSSIIWGRHAVQVYLELLVMLTRFGMGVSRV